MGEFQFLDEGTSEAQNRLATSFLFAQTSTGLATTGVLAGLSVAQTTTASTAVLVAAGAAPVQASVGTGVAFMVNDTVKTLDALTANPVGGLPRNDIVVFDSVTKAVIPIIGTPNASPADPTVPATACHLARLRHAASATTIPAANIDDLRGFVNLAGVEPLRVGGVAPAPGASIVYQSLTRVGQTVTVTFGIDLTSPTEGMAVLYLESGFRPFTDVVASAMVRVSGLFRPAGVSITSGGTVSVLLGGLTGATRVDGSITYRRP